MSGRTINHVRSALRDFYPDADEQDLWLNAPHPFLNGAAPMDLIVDDNYEALWPLIDQLGSEAAHV